MYLNGHIWKEGRHWLIEIPALDIMTQGDTKKEAFEMISDAVESHINCKGFKTTLIVNANNSFYLTANTLSYLVALMLKRQRIKNGLSLADVANRLNLKSRNAYAQYEQGRSLPSLTKIHDFLNAINENMIMTVGIEEESANDAA